MAEVIILSPLNKPLDLSKPATIVCHKCKNELEVKYFLKEIRLPGGRGKVCYNCRAKHRKEAERKRKEDNQFFEF